MVGSPKNLPKTSPGPKRLGPVTAPTVVAQTTKPIDLPVLPGTGISVAAKRACSEVAEPAPSRKIPNRRRGNSRRLAALITVVAPVIARAAPVAREILLPLA
ncbi:unannotated protein [freshwater metagenome]|uniref:Unannotated protein n=1 Tax=freshwater metagenome TaxID=449393 RepID=A0A6J6NQX0_9ZZZZ